MTNTKINERLESIQEKISLLVSDIEDEYLDEDQKNDSDKN